MGIFKSTFGVVGRIAAAPSKFLYPDSSRANHDRLFNLDNYIKTVYCPSCGESYLKLYTDDTVPQRMLDKTYFNQEITDSDKVAHWGCPECDFCYSALVTTENPKETVDDLKDFIRNPENQHIFFDEDVFLSENAAPIIARHMRNAYIFYVLSALVTVLFFVGLYKHQLFFSITMTLFVATFLMNGLRWSYRAWQLHTRNVYAENPKEQFYEWLKTANPLKFPNK